MARITDFPARGKIIEVRGSGVVFQPAGTNYQIELDLPDGDSPPRELDRPVEGLIHVRARKIWTVPSGGNFVAPIFGPPRTIQGRVKWLNERLLVVHAGTPFVVAMPATDQTIDLAAGPMETGSLVNVTLMPGAMIEARGAEVDGETR